MLAAAILTVAVLGVFSMYKPGEADGSAAAGEVESIDVRSPLMDEVVSCASLLPGQLPRINVEHNTVLDAEHGLLQITTTDRLSRDVNVTIDYRNDTQCRDIPVMASIVADAVGAWQQALETQCPDLQEFLDSGATQLEGRPINRDALARYISSFCQP